VIRKGAIAIAFSLLIAICMGCHSDRINNISSTEVFAGPRSLLFGTESVTVFLLRPVPEFFYPRVLKEGELHPIILQSTNSPAIYALLNMCLSEDFFDSKSHAYGALACWCLLLKIHDGERMIDILFDYDLDVVSFRDLNGIHVYGGTISSKYRPRIRSLLEELNGTVPCRVSVGEFIPVWTPDR